MFGKIFNLLFITLLATPAYATDYFIQFDTVTIVAKETKCHFWSTMSTCVYFPDSILKQYKPTKIIKTNIPKFQKFERYQGGYWFKVVKC